MRSSGILLPVFSLPSPYGIGCFSKEAEKFIDSLERSGQSFWQILPLGPTSYGDSPYQSPSAFAGNPYFIDIEYLAEDGLLTEKECLEYMKLCPRSDFVDYGFLYETRHAILKKAFLRFEPDTEYTKFAEQESFWLQDWAEFAAVKEYFGGQSLENWEIQVRLRERESLTPLIKKLMPQIEYHKFLQYQFHRQWQRIRAYARKKGIQIIGDMPIYTAYDSADSWCMPHLFDFDENLIPIHVAGCPPDSFSPDGQLWGNPVYNWDYHSKTGYKWWIERMRRSMRLYDVVRIDHFRGFESFYSIAFGREDAKRGNWLKGGGTHLFTALKKACPDLKIIAEDLGFITDDVKRLLAETGYPGMKVLQFAFDSRDVNDYLPHNYTTNAVVYTGTHDNTTALHWAQSAKESDIKYAAEYMDTGKTAPEIAQGLVRLAMASVADICIIPFQDWIGLGKEGRINTPSTLGDNWRWRMAPNSFDRNTESKIRKSTALYGRIQRKADKNVY